MTFVQMLNIWTGSTPMNIIIWFTLIILVLYFAKHPVYKAIRSLCIVIHEGLTHMASSLLTTEERVKERNREVLLTAGMEAIESHIERDFDRVNTIVERDLSGFPVLKRQLFDLTSKIDEDYQQSSEIPPSPPEWVEAVESLAKLSEGTNDTKAVTNILKEIHKTTSSQHKTSMDEYRKAVAGHHSALNRLLNYWRETTQTLNKVGKIITGIQERSAKIDRRMDEYENIRANTDKAERMLSSSSMTQFFISGFFLAIAVGGAYINFFLISLPMSEMVGGGSYIGNFRTSDVAALVIILVEASLGLFFMESKRVTRLFPIIGQMDDKMRSQMQWITFSMLFFLACIEASLAVMRDRIAANSEALMQTLSGSEVFHSTNSFIPTVGQVGLSFLLPFILALVAIPLESFVHSARTVFGVLISLGLQLLSFFLNLTGKIIINIGELIISIYDIVIFPLLWIEDLIIKRIKMKNCPEGIPESAMNESKSENNEPGPINEVQDKIEEEEENSSSDNKEPAK